MASFPPTRRKGLTLMLLLLCTAVPALHLDSPTVLRMQDVYPGSDFFPSRIPGHFLPITDPGVKKAPDPGSATLLPRWGGLLRGESWCVT